MKLIPFDLRLKIKMRKSLCRKYYGRLLNGQNINCPSTCPLFHPSNISAAYTREYNRTLGYCYCGARLISVLNRRLSTEDSPSFYMMCSRSRKSMNRCR